MTYAWSAENFPTRARVTGFGIVDVDSGGQCSPRLVHLHGGRDKDGPYLGYFRGFVLI